MDILEKLLHDLQSSVDGEGDSDNFDSNNLVSNIEICLQGLEADDMDAGISLLLTSQVPQNIFFYFDKTIRTKDRDVIKSKISAFKLISSLVKQVAGINANEHISVILDGCLNIFSRENSNEVKSNCLGPVKNILRDLDAYPDVFAEHSPPASAFYETFTKELLTNRQAKGLRAELITTLGLLMRRIQASVDSDSGHLMEWTTAVCDRAYEMLSSNIIGNKDPDLPQMSGALSALDRCLSISISGSVNVSELWKMVLQVTSSLSNNTLTRYSHIRKALRLVCNHGALFVKVVGLNAQQAYNVFIACLQADKDTLKKYAERAVLVVLADMAQYACFAAASSVLGNAGEYTDVCMKTVMALSSKYILSLNSLGTRKAEYDIAVKGLSALAPAFQYYDINELNRSIFTGGVTGILKEIIKSAEHFMRRELGNDDSERYPGVLFYPTKVLERKADFLLAVTSILLSSKTIPDEDITLFLTRYGIDLIVGYSRLWLRTRQVIHTSLQYLFAVLVQCSSQGHPDLLNLVDTLLSALLARTVSRLVQGEVPEMSPFDAMTGELDDHLYTVYMPLWEALFESTVNSNAVMVIGDDKIGDVLIVIFDTMMRCIQRYFKESDLRYASRGDVPETDDNETDDFIKYDVLLPHNAADQELLLNLTSFMEQFLPKRFLVERFRTVWLHSFVTMIIKLSELYSSVSTLYRALCAMLNNCGIVTDTVIRDSSSGMSINTILAVKTYCESLIVEVSSFQQELLLSALSLLLSRVVLKIIGFCRIAPVVKVALTMENLLEASLSAMEMFHGDPDLLAELSTILPMLDRHLIGVTAAKSAVQNKASDSTGSSEKQRSILRFLGRLGGYNKLILSNEANLASESVAWTDGGCTVPYTLPLQNGDVSMNIYFDAFIPRIVELCNQVSDSNTRALASELLHSVLILMIGGAASNPSYQSNYQNSETTLNSGLYSRLFPVGLTLAVSKDMVCRTLFDKLMLQIVHWFSGSGHVPPADMNALLDALVDGISKDSDSELRDFSAKLIAEFFRWSIKQSSGSEMKKGISNSPCELLLTRILVLVAHPLPDYRSGGVSVCNKIYTPLRDEVPLVERYVLQIIFSLLQAIRFGDTKNAEQALHRYIQILVKSVQRSNGEIGIVLHSRDELNSISFEESDNFGCPKTVSQLLKWAYNHICHHKIIFRRSCMMLLASVSPVISYDEAIRKAFFAKVGAANTLRVNDDRFTAFYITNIIGVQKNHTLREEASGIECIFSGDYLRQLASELDAFNWIVSSNIVAADDVFSPSILNNFPVSKTWFAWSRFLSLCYRVINGEVIEVPVDGSHTDIRAEILRRGFHLMLTVLDRAEILSSINRNIKLDIIEQFENLELLTNNVFIMIFKAMVGRSKVSLAMANDIFPNPANNTTMSTHLPFIVNHLLQCIRGLNSPSTALAKIMRDLQSSSRELINQIMDLDFILTCGTDIIRHVASIVHMVKAADEGNSLSCRKIINCAFQLAENATSADDTANAEALITFTIDMGAAQIVATDDGLVDKMLSSGEQGFRFLQVCADKLASAAVACPTDAVNNVSELIKRMELSFDTDNESKWTFFTIKVFEKLRASLNQWPAQDLIDCTGILVNKMGIFAKSVAVLQILCDIDVLVRSFVFEALDIISQVSALSIMFRKRLVDILVPILSNSSSVGSDKILSYLGICQNALMGTSRSCPRKMVELAGTDVETKRLIESFEELVANKFPIDTVALDQSSPGGIEFIALLSGYLSILVSTGSVDLLGPLLPSLRAGSKHRFYRWIVKSFSKLISGMDMCLDNVLAMFNFCYRILTDKDEDVKVKHTVKNYIWVPLLARAPMDIMVTLASLSLISDGSVTKLKALSESSSVLFVFVSLIQKATPSSSEDSESFYVTLQCAYILLEALYDRCAISIIKSDIAQAYAGPAATGKELTTALCRAAHKQVRITITSKTLEQQGASSAAFNCLLTVVAKTQSEEKHYDNFIFTEKSTEPYWKHIIECQTSYVFQAECSLFSTRMLGPSVDANDNIPPNSFGAANGSSKFGLNSFSKDYFGSSLHTLSSQMAESLSNDAVATNGNANHQAKGFGVSSVVDDDIFFATQSADGGDLALKSSRHNNYDNTVSMIRTDILNDAVAGFDDYSVSLELNDINTQSCMGPLIRVILRMAFLFNERWQLTPAITPKWLREILTRIEDVALDRNIRLFFLRLLFNQPITSIVSTWTSEIIPVVIEASISLTCNSNCGMVQEYNYFLRDIVFTLVDTWASADVIVDAIPNCSQFICSIIGLCYNSKTPLLNENVSSITSLISLWAGKGQISLDSIGPILQPALSPLFSSAIQPTGGAHAAASSRGSEAVKQRLTGLKLIRCFLDNGLDLLKSEVFNSAGSYVLSYVTEAIKYPRKEVLQLASAVVGRLLVIIKTAKYRVIGECDGFELLVERTIASKLAQKGGLDDVATMIFAISEKYTQFGNRELILRLLSMFSQLSSRSKSYMLWFLVRSTRVYDPPLEVVDYLSPYWGPLLSDLFTVTEGRGSRMKHIRVIRLYTIRLIYRHVPGIKLAWFSSIIGKSAVEGLSLVTTVDSNNEGNLLVRKEAFALLIKLYDYFNTKLEQPYAHSVIDPTVLDTKQMITELRQRILIMLMKGLTDIDDTGMNQSNPCNNSVVDSLRSNMEGNSNIITSVDIGIRRMVYDFLKEQVSIMGPDVESAPTGVSKKRRRTDELSMHRRCCALMTQYYDPQCSELWLNYAGYLLLDVCVSDNNGYSSTKHIFDRGLANDTQFSKMEIVPLPGSQNDSLVMDPRRPMFSLERTTQSLLSQSNSTSISQDIVLSQFGASSQFYQPRQTGYLRGTQKFDWSQTQSASQRINGNDDNDIADLSTRASNSATRRNVFAPTQFLTSNLPSFLKSINGEFSGDFVSSIAIIVPTQNSQAHNGIISNPRTSSQTILSQRGNNAKLMPPPVGLPTQFFSKALISQRLPHRFQSSSSNSNSDDSSYLKGTTQKYYSSRLRSAQQKRQQQSKQQNRVNVYRKYRTGELPDICISHLDIIRPLQALCLKDSKLASILFNSLFEAMYGSVRDENGSYDTESINLKLRESLFMMFCGGDNSDASTLLRVSDRQLISCLLLCSRHCLALEADLVTQNSMNSKKVKSKPLDFYDIPRSKRMALEPDYNHKESFSEDKLNMFVLSELSPSLVATLSLQSMNYHSGILFLEEQIMVRDLRLTEVKNSGQRSSHSDKHLHHLCSLYEALGDKDTLVGLYVKLSSFEETSRALDAELAGNFHEAIEVYNDLIMKHRLSTLSRRSSESSNNCGGSPPILSGDAIAIFPSEDEVELWDDRSLQCLQQLLDWGQLDEKLNMIAEAHYFEPMITGSFEPSTWESFLLNPSAVLADKKKKYIPLKLNCLINIEESEDYLRLFLERLLIAPRNSPEEKLRQYIEKAHPVELATCFGVVGDWNKVKCNVIICYDQFLNTWPVLHRNATKARNALLLQLQTVSELEDSALFKLDKLSVEDGNSTFKSGFDKSLAKRKLLSRWSNSLPSIGDSVNAWNSVIKVRHLLLDSEGGIDAASHLSKMHIKFARAAVYQRSVRVVKGQITIGGKYRRAAQTDTAAKDCVTLDEVLAVHAYNQLTIDALTKTNHYSADLDKILSIFDKTRGLLDRKIGQIAEECSKIDSMGNYHNTDYTKLSIMRANWMCAKWSVLGNKNSGEGIRVATEAFDMLQEIARGISNRSSSASVEQLKQLLGYQHITLLGTTYERLAHHCNLLRQQGTMELTSAASDVVGVCIDSYLKGLQLGDLACRDRVVSIIQLVSSHYPSNLIPDRIISAIRKVPSWMFLRHAAQLMGYFDRPEGPIATVVLEQVAEKYPAALHYHFKIASERLGAQGINLVRCLSRKLANHSVDCFVEALDGLTHPDLRLTDALKEVVLYHRNVVGSITDAMIREAAKSLNDKNSVQNLPYVTLCKMINKCKDDSTILSWPHVQGKIGNYNRSFAKEIKKFFDANLPKLSGSPELFKLSDTTISSLFAKARETISKAYDGGKVLLSEFSHWLAEFDFDLHNVEIPGQYICSGFSCEPDVSKHSLIMGFDPQLLVMSSIRRPKRLTIYGESGIFKQFLVKGGEDLRNDDRIEQLFSLMNSIISQSSGVRLTQTLDGMDDDMMSKSAFALVGNDQNLAARTFGVVPMTSKLGILEWCQGTIPFKAVMQAELAKDKYFVSTNPSAVVKLPQSNRGRPSTLNISLSGDEIIIAGSEASKIRQKWLTDEGGYVGTIKKMSLSGSGNSNPRSCVLAEGMITSLWQQMISTIPNDLLRRFLLSKATSPEAFYAFRANFTRTIAIASIYGYVLGIGDRHLDNLLIDKLTGDVVMIDFGICFGMGASQLPVPELIPFRLTPQITNVSRPLDGVSHLRNYMLKALTAIRNKDGVERLKNDLEVYINDPLVDWIKGSGVQKEEIEALREKLTWEPRRRIDAVVKKIKGVNPITILLNDLSINASVKKNNIIDGYCNLLGLIDGSAVACFRQETAQASNPKNVPKKRMRTVEDVGHPELSDGEVVFGLLTPPEQIDILLKLGTSPEILCRQYEGLVTWM